MRRFLIFDLGFLGKLKSICFLFLPLVGVGRVCSWIGGLGGVLKAVQFSVYVWFRF